MKCTHGLVEMWQGRLCINTMNDYIPVSYCPECGKKIEK